MKKVISVILAIVMTFSISVTVFAENDTVKLNEKNIVSIGIRGNKEFYNFTTAEKGIYVLKAEIIDSGSVKYSVIYNSNSVITTRVNQITKQNEVLFCAEENSTLSIMVHDAYLDTAVTGDETVTSAFIIEKYDVPTAIIGENKVKDSGTYFSFIPEQSGYYNFHSNAPEGVDPKIEIYDINGLKDENDNSGLKDDKNFDLTANLEKGKVYGIKCEASSGFSYTVSYNKKVGLGNLIIDNGYIMFERLNIADFFVANNHYEVPLTYVPNGAKEYTNLKAESGDENVVSASINSDGNLVLDTHNALFSTVTITITSDNGLKVDYNILVMSEGLTHLSAFGVMTLVFLAPVWLSIYAVIDTIKSWF